MASRKKNFLKIVILGDSGVGKTSLLQQYLSGSGSKPTRPTIGADFSKKEIMIDNTVVTLQIWDTAGQEKFQSLGYAFYRGADCCALTYDITNATSFQNLLKWKDGFLEHSAPEDPEHFPFVLLGNKVDKEPERQISSLKATEWCKANGDMPYFETSAKESIAVDEAFVQMAKNAVKRSQTQQIMMPPTIGDAAGAVRLNSNRHGNQPNVERNICSC